MKKDQVSVYNGKPRKVRTGALRRIEGDSSLTDRAETVDARERFEKALGEKAMGVTGIPTLVVRRPDKGEAVYRYGAPAQVVDLGAAMSLGVSFVYTRALGWRHIGMQSCWRS